MNKNTYPNYYDSLLSPLNIKCRDYLSETFLNNDINDYNLFFNKSLAYEQSLFIVIPFIAENTNKEIDWYKVESLFLSC